MFSHSWLGRVGQTLGAYQLYIDICSRRGGSTQGEKISLPKEDASDSWAKQACLLVEGTSKGPWLHPFLELTKYSLSTVLFLNLSPFAMIVIDIDSRITFKVDCEGRVNRVITKRTVCQEDHVAKGVDYQEISNYHGSKFTLLVLIPKKWDSPHIQPHPKLYQ